MIAILYIHFGIGERFFWRFWWWDVILHVLGGMWVALAVAWLLRLRDTHISLFQCALAAFVVGVAWELFELAFHIGGSVFLSYPVDTAKDLVDDVAGGVAAWFLVRYIEKEMI